MQKKIRVKLSIAVFYKKHIILKFFFFSVYPCICIMDPDLDLVPVIFYIDLQNGKKKEFMF
jgi:hypothetical protein